jgi:teichoic acid transport system permease protein
VITAFMRFLPTIGIYAVVHGLSGLPVRWGMLWVIPIMLLLLVMATGFTVFVAAAQVYFRDLNNLLGHVLRLWLYVSPVLYYAQDVPARYHILLLANPIAPLLTAWNDALTGDGSPTPQSLEVGGAWAIVIFILGCLFFISREREFAVRL